MKISERVEAALFGDIRHREGDFESVAADVLGLPQAQIDELLRAEKSAEDSRKESVDG